MVCLTVHQLERCSLPKLYTSCTCERWSRSSDSHRLRGRCIAGEGQDAGCDAEEADPAADIIPEVADARGLGAPGGPFPTTTTAASTRASTRNDLQQQSHAMRTVAATSGRSSRNTICWCGMQQLRINIVKATTHQWCMSETSQDRRCLHPIQHQELSAAL